MKKNLIIIILILITSLSMFYAFIKAKEAERSAELAWQSQNEAEALQDEVIQIQQKAEESAAAALEQRDRAERALQDCQNK